ncbi:MAG: PHP domain-containing protein, partial [Pigeon pea little leaf phytoplasma]|nr:PHP domain-containing protein [Pigeon pea little leaf phytoplasma]
MKFYSKFINFIKNKNIKNFPLIEVIVNDKQTKSWDCFFQIEEYPEEITHFNIFEKEFKDFFLKQLSEDLENFVELQPIINVHFRILDWNLLKDDYIWKKHYQYMLDKLLTYPDIDKELISCFRTTPFIYVDSKKCLFVKDKNFDKKKRDITEIFNIEVFQSKLSQLQCLMWKIYKFEFQFELIFTFKDLEEIKKSKKNITSNQQIKIKGYVQHHSKYHDLKWNKIGFELVDPENFLNFIVVNSWLSKKTKKIEEISQKLIDLLPEGSLVLITIKIVKKIYYNLEDLEEFEILEQIPEQRYLFPEIFIDENKFEEEFKLFFNKLRINRILIECCVQYGEKNDPKKNRFYLVDPNSHQDSILITEWLNHFNIDKKKSSLSDIPEGTLILATISINEKSIKDKVVYFSLVRYKKLELKIKLDDYSGTKRIEFHTHTKMSNLDAIVSVKDYIELAEKWGHKSIAFTDHDGLYAFPEIAKNVKGKNIKAILGVELSFLEENSSFITNQEVNLNKFSDFCLINHNYIVLDIETTGFSINRDSIISIAAIKIKEGKIVDFFDELINPGDNIKINDFIQKLTNISNEMVATKPHIKKVFLKFLEFINNCSDCVLVAHNASFDIDFLKEIAKKNGLIWPLLPVIDTLFLAQKHFNEIFKYFSLERIVKSLKIKLDLNDFKNFASYEMVEIFRTKFDRENQYHNALFDAYATSRIFLEMLHLLEQKQILSFYDLRGTFDNKKFERPYHVNILVKNKQGYKNLFRLISDALTKDFIRKPLLVKSNFEKNREGLLIGSGCFDSNVFNIALYKNDDELAQAISYYDYIEVQPPQAYRHIIYDLNGSFIDDGNNPYGLKIIKDTIKKIIVESLKQNKIIIATGDVHYLYPYEKVLREVYINAKLIGGGLHRLSEYPSEHLPDNYFLTTQEMLDAFSFISDEKLKQDLVINNTHVLDRKIERFDFLTDKLFDIPDDMFSQNLNISSINKEFNGLINKRIIELFEEKIHPLVKCRIMQELSVILPKDTVDNNNIVAIYYLSYLLVKRSTEDGYPVGSRGSVGASLIANILGITEINPLPPHYRCIKCKYIVLNMNLNQTKTSEYYDYVQSWPFFVDVLKYQKNFDNIFSGYDLPN